MRLEANGKIVDVDVTGFEYEGVPDILRLTTADGEELVVKDSPPTPAPTPDPDPTPDRAPEIPSEVVMGSHYTNQQDEQRGYMVTIPQGKILSSRIPANLGKGSINFQQNGERKPKFDFWISSEPGGPAVSGYCSTEGANKVLTQEFETGEEGQFGWSCVLMPDDDHYLNIAHTDPLEPASRVNRKIY